MNNLQVFNFNKHEVRTLLVDNEPYFVGKDVADVLGYERADNAIRSHVYDEDKLMHQISASGQRRNMTLINESGLYSLILSSKLPQAREFKRWVTSEVLPSIRKTGFYQVPSNPMDALKLMFKAQEQTNDRLDNVAKDVKELKENKMLTPGEYNYLSQRVKYKIKEVKEMRKMTSLNTKQSRKLYQSINHDLNMYLGIHTRSQVRAKDLDRALEFIAGWEPSYTDLKLIEQLALEI